MMKRKIIYTLLTTLCLIILANVWAARQAKKRNLLSSIPTALIDGYILEMEKGFDTWFIGNSTLDKGVIAEKVITETNRSVLKTPMGSASAEAMCLLTAKGLTKTSKLPAEIYLFVTKDDFNSGGLRGETSASYIKAIKGKVLKEEFLSHIPLYSYRISLKKKYEKDLKAFFNVEEREGNTTEKSPVKNSSKLKIAAINETHNSHLINLGKNFTLNTNGLSELSKLCRSKGIKLSVVFLPVTQSVINWQNYYYPNLNYNTVMNSVKTTLQNNSISYTDYSDTVPSNTYYFKDEYHLSKKGAVLFTNILIGKLNTKKGKN